jgi:hypothetical protein
MKKEYYYLFLKQSARCLLWKKESQFVNQCPYPWVTRKAKSKR